MSKPAAGTALNRRHFGQVAIAGLVGCVPSAQSTAHIQGSFTGINFDRGHMLRKPLADMPAPSVVRKTDVLIVGGGVAGLAAARALRQRGVEDLVLLELEDSTGGNSRGGVVQGLPCPLGAHYLPLPSNDAHEVQDLLEELGLRRRVAGRWEYNERHLCHSPQERLFFQGAWQDGLLPAQGVGAATLAQYRKFSALVEQLRREVRWSIPASKSPNIPVKRALAATTFVAYLDQHGLTDPHLRWYLDYCCRDDYGAGLATVSAWAGIHYFASRHGFHAPDMENAEREGVLTWPEGNAWLTRQLASPLQDRVRTGQVVLRIGQTKHGVEVDAFNTRTEQLERWQARRAVVALPVFVAASVVQDAPDFVRQAAQQLRYAPWLVANMHIHTPLHDRPGAAPSWDNVLYGDNHAAPGLGYVDATHQSLQTVPAATVLTYYRALGDMANGRRDLLEQPWQHWRDAIVRELSAAHPDLAAKITHLDITRYGHAMAIPTPSVNGYVGYRPLQDERKKLSKIEQIAITHGRLSFAHSDWAGYSVFEEAFTLGDVAGRTLNPHY